MRIRLTVFTIFFFFYAQAQFVDDNKRCSQWTNEVNRVYNGYKTNENIKRSDIFFKAAKYTDSLLSHCNLEEKDRKSYILKRSIMELHGLILLDVYEYRFVERPSSKKKKFLEKVKALQALPGNSEDESCKNHVLGCYYTYVTEDYEEAEKYFQKAYAPNSTWDILLKDRAWNFMLWGMKFHDKNFDSADKYYGLAEKVAGVCLDINAKLSDLYIILGYVYAYKRDIKKAMEFFDTAGKLQPENPRIDLAKGYCFGKIKNWDAALFYDRKAVELSPGYMKAYTNMAQHYASRSQPNDIDSANSLYTRCIANNPYEPTYYKYLGDLFLVDTSKKDNPEKLASVAYYYSKAAQLDSSFFEVLGDHFYKMTFYDSAIVHYKQKLKFESNLPRIYYKIGRSFYRKGNIRDNDSAIFYFQKAVQLDSNYAWAHLLLGETAYSNDKNLARKHLYKFLTLPLLCDSSMPAIIDKVTKMADSLMNNPDDIPTAYKYYLTAARQGNEAAQFATLGLKYEMGYDGVQKDTCQAVFWYRQAAQRFPVMRIAWKRLVNLSATLPKACNQLGADHSLWKQLADLDAAATRQKEVSIVSDDGNDTTLTVSIMAKYPNGVHPLEWEGQRLISDNTNYVIKNEDVNAWGMIMAYSKKETMSEMTFIETFDYLNNFNKISVYDSIFQKSLQKFDRYNKMLDKEEIYEKIIQLQQTEVILEEMLNINSTPILKKKVSDNYDLLAREYISLKHKDSYQQAVNAAEKALSLRRDNVDAASYLFAALWCLGQKDKAQNEVYNKYRPLSIYEMDTYDDVFLNNIGYFLKEEDVFLKTKRHLSKQERDSIKKAQITGLLEPASKWIDTTRSLKNKNFQLLTSEDTAEIYKAVVHCLRSSNKDTIQLARKLIEKFIHLQQDSVYAVKYLDWLLHLSVYGSSFASPSLDTVEMYFEKSGLPNIEYPFIKHYLGFIDKDEFQDMLNTELYNWKNEDDANDYNFWLENAVKLKSEVRYGLKRSNTSRVLSARKAVNWFEVLQEKFKDDSTWQKTIAKNCGSFSYTIILLKDFQTALRAALIAQEADSTEAYYKTNLPLAYLLTGNFEKAKELYLRWRNELFVTDYEKRKYSEVFMDDFKDLEDNGITHTNFDKIRNLLMQ